MIFILLQFLSRVDLGKGACPVRQPIRGSNHNEAQETAESSVTTIGTRKTVSAVI